jgi:hypothetical protein
VGGLKERKGQKRISWLLTAQNMKFTSFVFGLIIFIHPVENFIKIMIPELKK